MVQTAAQLAIEGGPRAVTLPPGDRWQTISEAEIAAVAETMRSGHVYAPTALFEQEFAAFVGAKHALAMCNGTATIHSALFACLLIVFAYTVYSGYWGVATTHGVQYIFEMGGAITLAIVALSAVGGVNVLKAKLAFAHPPWW